MYVYSMYYVYVYVYVSISQYLIHVYCTYIAHVIMLEYCFHCRGDAYRSPLSPSHPPPVKKQLSNAGTIGLPQLNDPSSKLSSYSIQESLLH